MQESWVRPLDDVTPATWLTTELTEFTGAVGDLVTRGYAAYARIFHRPDQGLPVDGAAATWAEAAAREGTTLHPAAQWSALAPADEDPPVTGCLDPVTLLLLCEVLGAWTTTPESCRLAVWVGYGAHPASWWEAPSFHVPGRRYRLFDATLAGVVDVCRELDQTPNLWWPEDRAWLVATEIDHDSTVVGGSRGLVESLLAAPGIECLEVTVATSLLAGADKVNGS